MYVVLARHGNTFDPGEPAVWVGARTDLPLVAKGRDQATRIGAALKTAGLVPRRALTGPLKRTRETASLALAAAGADSAPVEVDQQLREIDYGPWEGKGSDEIRRMGWTEELKAWDEDNAWPSRAGWPSSASEYLRGFQNVLDDVGRRRDDPTFIVSSNGVFKLFASLMTDNVKIRKMGTGHLALLRLEGVTPEILCWDLPPESFLDWIATNPLA
jgi:broad specificity phosphatase PhoE